MRTANAVGADTATSTGAPIIADFWTISMETRLVNTTSPDRALAPSGEGPGKLVERVMAADILSDRNEAALRLPETGRVDGMGLAVQELQREQRVDGGHDLVGREDAAFADLRGRPHRFDQALHAAKPAARGASHLPPPAQELRGLGCLQPNAQLDAHLLLDDVNRIDGIDRRDDAFGQAEAYGKVLEVLWGGHHHRVRSGVVGNGDSRLFGDGALALSGSGGAPNGMRTQTTGRSKGLLRRAGLGVEASPLAQGFQAIVPWCAALPRAFDALLVYSSAMVKGAFRIVSLSRSPAVAAFALAALLAGYATPGVAEDKERGPCIEDAMLVFDASGSMAGNLNQGIATTIPRINEVRSALAKVLPSITRFRRVGLITYGPGPYQQCNVQLALKPVPDAAGLIMQEVNALTPAGKMPLTAAVEQAAEVLD